MACCLGAQVSCLGVVGRPAGWRAAAASALAVALWMRLAERRRLEEEVEDIQEDEYEEEVAILGDAGCAAMGAGAALRAAAASAAATAGRIEGIASGCRLGTGGPRGPAATWWPVGPIWSAAVRGGGAGLRSPPSGSGCAGLLQCGRVWASVSPGGNSSCGLHSEARGVGSGVLAVCVGGMCWSLGGMGVPWGLELFAAAVCGLLGVGGGEAR